MKKLALVVATVLASFNASAKWVENQVVILSNPTVHHGTTRTGNDKWFITISDGVSEKNVAVSKGNAEASKITLVKWVDDETGKIKYSTRSAVKKVKTPDFDIKKVSTK